MAVLLLADSTALSGPFDNSFDPFREAMKPKFL